MGNPLRVRNRPKNKIYDQCNAAPHSLKGLWGVFACKWKFYYLARKNFLKIFVHFFHRQNSPFFAVYKKIRINCTGNFCKTQDMVFFFCNSCNL